RPEPAALRPLAQRPQPERGRARHLPNVLASKYVRSDPDDRSGSDERRPDRPQAPKPRISRAHGAHGERGAAARDLNPSERKAKHAPACVRGDEPAGMVQPATDLASPIGSAQATHEPDVPAAAAGTGLRDRSSAVTGNQPSGHHVSGLGSHATPAGTATSLARSARPALTACTNQSGPPREPRSVLRQANCSDNTCSTWGTRSSQEASGALVTVTKLP